MEIDAAAAASGGCSIRDLPPSKRFKYVGSNLGSASAPVLPLPAKKRPFSPPPGMAGVSFCLPAKKRAYAPEAEEESAVTACLPAKKRAYALPMDAIVPACLPAKKRFYPLLPQEDAAAPRSIPAKKQVQAPLPLEDAAASLSIPAKKRVLAPSPPEKSAASPSIPAKKRVQQASSPQVEEAASPSIPAKKRVQAPSPKEDTAALVPVCLPANKRVMPPFIPSSPSPSAEPEGARAAVVKKARTKRSQKHGYATNPRVANARAEASKVPISPNEIKEQVSMESGGSNTARESRDRPCMKLCNVVKGNRSEAQVDVSKKYSKEIDPIEAAPAREEESSKEGEDVAREQKQEAVEVEDDDGVLCAVCGSTDGDPSDPIVFCDGCDLMVHAMCYGNPLAQSIPDGDWFCSLCSDKANASMPTAAKKGKPARPSCFLCPARGGAMKRTTDGAWAHISCALLVPEVFFRDPDGREGIDCSRVPGQRFTKECYVCESRRGCALECSQPKCGLGFHVSCGIKGGLCIEYQEGKAGAVVASFCWEHTKLWKKQQLTGKYKIVGKMT